MEEKIFGINPILECIRSEPERIQKLYLPQGNLKGKKAEIYSLCQQNSIKVQFIPISRFCSLVGEVNHQGVVAIVSPYNYQPLEVVLNNWRKSKEKALFLILDELQDPRNFGAIIRTAHIAGVHGIFVPKHRSAPISDVAFKASAGALAYVPICRVTNLVFLIENLKKEGIWIIGTDAQAKQSLYSLDSTLDIAVVIGGEGEGIRLLVKKHCDFLVAIPSRGKITALNASVAAGIVLYEIIRQRYFV